MAVTTNSDAVTVSTIRFLVLTPTSKRFPIPAVDGEPGRFSGPVIFSTATDDANHVFTSPGTDSLFAVYFEDPLCEFCRPLNRG